MALRQGWCRCRRAGAAGATSRSFGGALAARMAHTFSSMAARAPEVEAELHRELLTLLNGEQVDEAWVSKALGGSYAIDRSSLEQQHAVHGNMGVLDTGQSLSADLRVRAEGAADGTQQRGMYIKKIQAKRFAHKKTPQNLRRDLASCHNECSFYKEIVPVLQASEQQAAVVRIPRCYYVGEQSFHTAESEEQMAQSEYMLVLESMTQDHPCALDPAPVPLCQHSPLCRAEAMQSLDLIARFHAWAWNNPERLTLVRSKLLQRASYWDLPRRGEAEMHRMPEIWANFLESFANKGIVGDECEELLARASVIALADRMLSLAPWVSEQIHGDTAAPWKTMVHGDYKAMNVFVPVTPAETDHSAALIDFQWTGVGLGMLDVAMHLYHSVELSAMQDGGEEELLRYYHTRLLSLLSDADAAAYPWGTAKRHYQLCLLDYGRVVMSCFWSGASEEAFAAKAERQNCSMVYRRVDTAMRFVRRLDECAAELELDREREAGGGT